VPILDVVDRFAPAIGLYERAGWRRLGTVKVQLPDGTDLREHVYVAPDPGDDA
jgi:ribosomal protein S18 acetylase RimI-like enzyme